MDLSFFDGKSLLIGLSLWAAAFNIWRAQRFKRQYQEAEQAFTAMARENVALRAKRDLRYPNLKFTCAPEMHK
jgi:hypothetical protein